MKTIILIIGLLSMVAGQYTEQDLKNAMSVCYAMGYSDGMVMSRISEIDPDDAEFDVLHKGIERMAYLLREVLTLSKKKFIAYLPERLLDDTSFKIMQIKMYTYLNIVKEAMEDKDDNK